LPQLRDKSIDPSAAVLGDFFPDRYRSFLGVIVRAVRVVS